MTAEAQTPTRQPVTTADRTNAVAESLRQIARAARFADRRKGIQSYHGYRSGDRWLPILFVAFFVAPCLIGLGYLWFIASDRYVSEVRFAVRPGIGGLGTPGQTTQGSDGGTGVSSASAAMVTQDTMIVANYIMSRPMIEAMDRKMPLRGLFSRDSTDWFSRFNPKRPIEWLVWYWQSRVYVEIDPSSAIITLRVNTFDPKDTFELTKAIIAESELVVNRLSLKSREDAMAEAKRELALAERRMAETQVKVRNLRNNDGVLDASKSNEANLNVIGQLRKTRVDLSVQLALLLRDIAPERRPVLDLKAQIQDIDDNIARLEREAASQNPERRKVLADSLTQFEAYENERLNAQTFYANVLNAHEVARTILARQIEFLSLVVEPVQPQSPEEPRRILLTCLILAGSAVLFAISLFIRRSTA